MTQNNNWFSDRTPNWWFTKILSLFALLYLIVSLILPPGTQSSKDNSSQLKTEHIILFAIILLFNSDLIEKIDSTSIGNMSAKFATKEAVDSLSKDIETLTFGTVLDAWEFVTLQKVDGRREDSFYFDSNGQQLLLRLVNRDLIRQKGSNTIFDESSIFHDKKERPIQLKNFFDITTKGKEYLRVADEKKLSKDLEKIAGDLGYRDKQS